MDSFPYRVSDVGLGLSRPGWIFSLMDVVNIKYERISPDAQLQEAMGGVQSFLYMDKDTQGETGFALVQQISKDDDLYLASFIESDGTRSEDMASPPFMSE